MYTPTAGDVHVNTPLTQISIAYLQNQDQFVAAQMCPVIPVSKQSDRYYVYNRGDFFRDQMQKRAPGTPAASAGYRLDNTPTYFCRRVGREQTDSGPVARQRRRGPEHGPRRHGVPLAAGVDPAREDLRRQPVRGGQVGHRRDRHGRRPRRRPVPPVERPRLERPSRTSAPANSPSSRPPAIPANTLVISEPVWLKLVDHPDLVDRVKYGQTNGGPARITREALAAILEIDRILVMGSIENTAGEGLTAVALVHRRQERAAVQRRSEPRPAHAVRCVHLRVDRLPRRGQRRQPDEAVPLGDHRLRHRRDRDGLRHQTGGLRTRVLLQGAMA